MGVREVAARHARVRARLAERMRREARIAWRQVDRRAISETWTAQVSRLLFLLTVAQRDAASTADLYLADVLARQNITARPEGLIVADAYAGVASDGRDLVSLMALPAIAAKTAIGQGYPVERAMAAGQALAELAAYTQVVDAGRVADGAALISRGQPGYVRMIVGKTCSRCIMLAGKWYRWNAGFTRHKKCDCVHIPAAENASDDLRTNPKALFDSMSRSEQDKVFTKAGAQAVRDGADLNQIVNARRGARGLTPAGARITAAEARMLRGGREVGRLEAVKVFGHDLLITTEGTTTRGAAGRLLGARETGVKAKNSRYRSARAPRLMPESIYQIAGNDRDEAIRLLRRFGYIT